MRFSVTIDSNSKETFSTACPKVLTNFEIRAKIRDLEQKMTNITDTKKVFLDKCYNAHQSIDITMKNIVSSIRAREQELKYYLQKIKCSKMLEWDRQLKLCQEAEQNLKNMDVSVFGRIEAIQDVFNAFAGNIGFIEAGEIKFQADDEDVLNDLKNFGKLSFGGSEKSLKKLQPKFAIEGKAKIPGKFWQPWGVCTDATGRILVTDCGNDRIQAFNEYGLFLFQFGKSGSGPGEFNRPSGITVDKKCRIIVSDKDNHRIQIFTYTGRFLISFGQKGTIPGEFRYPYDVAVNENCDIAVSDNRNNRIQLFNSHGGFLAQFGFRENIAGPSLRVCLQGVAFQPDGSLLVVDFNSHCVFMIDRNFSVVTRIGGKKMSLKRPRGIACNRQETFVVADGKYNRVQMFDEYGNLLRSFDVVGANSEGLSCLQGICFHPSGGFVVADFGNHRVLVF